MHPDAHVHTHSLAEWAAACSTGVAAIGLIALAVAFADADPSDFDPRPAVKRLAHRALDTDAGARLLVEITRLRHTLAALALAAYLRLAVPAVPNGATR